MKPTVLVLAMVSLLSWPAQGQDLSGPPGQEQSPPKHNLADLAGRCSVYIYSEERFSHSPRCRIQQLVRDIDGTRRYKFFWHILLSRREPIEPLARTRTTSIATRQGFPGVGVIEHIQFEKWGEVWFLPDGAAELSRFHAGGLPFVQSRGRPFITVRSDLHPLVTEVLVEAPIEE